MTKVGGYAIDTSTTLESNKSHVRTVMPGRLEMRSTGEQHQQGSGRCLLDEQMQPFKACGVRPMQVFQDKENRVAFGEFEEESNDGLKCFLALTLR